MTNKRVLALVDCDNFFVSCERLFRPDLEGRPVVVLSSNDGCAVSRSREAKALGIPMGAPAFKYRELFKSHGVISFSANFELYSDISRRIVDLLKSIAPHTEVYSVDESFIDLSNLPIHDYELWSQALRQRIFLEIGIPVSIGIAPTKTLAKLATQTAKNAIPLKGTLSLIGMSEEDRKVLLSRTAVEDIWGVGRRLAPKLKAEGIATALDLSRLGRGLARQLMGLSGLQTVSELNGIDCHPLDSLTLNQPHKSVLRSRTLGEDTNQLGVLEASIATLTTSAAFQIRQEEQLSSRAALFLSTSRFKPGFRTWYEEVSFGMPTNDSGHIIKVLTNQLQSIYSSTQSYHRVGVVLYDFKPARFLQTDLLGLVQPSTHSASVAKMRAIDDINSRFGKGSVYFAAEDLSNSWRPRQNSRSPRYTTKWAELPTAKFIPK